MKGITCCLATSVVVVLFAVSLATGQAKSLGTTEVPVGKDTTTVRVETTKRTGTVETSASTATTKKIQRPRRKWSEDEIENMAKKTFKIQEQARTKCQVDEFFNMEFETCSKCRKYCSSGEDVSACGIECRVYFNNARLQDRVVSADATNFLQMVIIIVLCCLLCMCIGLSIWTNVKTSTLAKRIARIEKRHHGEPNGDKNAGGTEESDESLLTNASQASGIDEPGAQP